MSDLPTTTRTKPRANSCPRTRSMSRQWRASRPAMRRRAPPALKLRNSPDSIKQHPTLADLPMGCWRLRMAIANIELLKRALEREAPAIITAGEGPTRRQVMVQLAKSNPKDTSGIWAHFHEEDAQLLQRLIDQGGSVGIWFQTGPSMIQFSSLLLKKRHGLGRHLLLIDWPAQISIVEERHQPRCMVPAALGLSARV